MAATVRVHFEVVPILSRLCSGNGAFGYLLGHRGDETVEIVSCVSCKENTDSNPLHYTAGGVEILGWFYSGAKKLDTAYISSDVKKVKIVGAEEGNSYVICATTQACQGVTDDNFFLLSDGGMVTKQRVTFTNEDILSNKLMARVKSHIPVTFDLGSNDSWKSALSKEIDSICQLAQSDKAVFHLMNSSVILGECLQCGVTAEADCIDLYDLVFSDDDFSRNKKKKQKKNNQHPLQFSMYFKLNGRSPHNKVPTCSPVITHNIGTFKSVDLLLPVDVIAVISPSLLVGELVDILSLAVCNQLSSMSETLIHDAKVKKEKFSVPVPYHFQPMGMQMIFTAVYLKDLTEDDLVSRRQDLHEMLGLPQDRPLFRRSNRMVFLDEQAKGGYLVSPHQGLTGSGLKGGMEYLVQGQYTYHHYMQDRFDDNKWGCAYRSLQTLVSWFRWQGYTDTPIPTHRQIQQALVDVGDKEAKFVGSRQWIGSMEVSYCLDHLLGVTSKIMFVSCGAELAGKGRELALHFQTQGTPIMIGGGVLAHTILGVDFNDVTGDVKFLILDPHYTGAEDIKVILDKGWCGWKGTDFWDQQAHYNLCMPQRPLVI